MTAVDLALEQLAANCTSAALPWSQAWRAPLAILCDVVAAGAKSTNLVGDPSPSGVCAHVLEALTVAACAHDVDFCPRRVADIGAGAGLAALTYALVWPQAQVFAVEPRRLRAEFICTAARACELTDRVVVVQQSLGAAIAAGDLAATIDLADARAVWPAAQWVERARPLVHAGGLIALHFRAGDAATELAVARARPRSQHAVPGPRDYRVALVRG